MSQHRTNFFAFQLRKTVGVALLVNAASALLGLVLSVLVVRYLGPKGYGVYTFVTSLPGIASAIIVLGYPTLIIRQGVFFKAAEEWGLFRGLIKQSIVTALLCGCIAGGVIWGFGMSWDISHRVVAFRIDLILAIMLLFVGALEQVASSSLQGLNLIVESLYPGSVVRPTLFMVFLVTAFLVTKTSLSVSLVLGGQVFLGCLVIGFQFYQFYHRISAMAPKRHAQYLSKLWMSSAIPFLFKGVLTTVNLRADVLLISLLRGTTEAGVYNVATRGAQLLVVGLGTIAMAVQPTIARLHAEGENEHLRTLLTRVSRYSFLMAILGVLFFVVFGKDLLVSLYGRTFGFGINALLILGVSRVVNASTGSLGPYMSMTGRAKMLAWSLAVEVVLNVVFNWILIPTYGINGSAIATGGSMAITNVILSIWLYKNSGFDVSLLGVRPRIVSGEEDEV